jgi:hypothetical protein
MSGHSEHCVCHILLVKISPKVNPFRGRQKMPSVTYMYMNKRVSWHQFGKQSVVTDLTVWARNSSRCLSLVLDKTDQAYWVLNCNLIWWTMRYWGLDQHTCPCCMGSGYKQLSPASCAPLKNDVHQTHNRKICFCTWTWFSDYLFSDFHILRNSGSFFSATNWVLLNVFFFFFHYYFSLILLYILVGFQES